MSVLSKLLSGRLISTVVVVLTYAYCAIHGIIDTNFIREITLIVLVFYFSKQRTENK